MGSALSRPSRITKTHPDGAARMTHRGFIGLEGEPSVRSRRMSRCEQGGSCPTCGPYRERLTCRPGSASRRTVRIGHPCPPYRTIEASTDIEAHWYYNGTIEDGDHSFCFCSKIPPSISERLGWQRRSSESSFRQRFDQRDREIERYLEIQAIPGMKLDSFTPFFVS